MKLCTIGSSKRSAKDFFSALKEANIQKLIDVRRRNTSHLCGFTKKSDLKFFLEECFGITYDHIPEFAPSEQLLTNYFKQIENKKYAPTAWEDYVQRFQDEVLSNPIVERFKKSIKNCNIVCLLCSEQKPDHCHRKLLAEHFKKHLPDIEIVHL
jgi:uncharacterized protein (DUF488 family)